MGRFHFFTSTVVILTLSLCISGPHSELSACLTEAEETAHLLKSAVNPGFHDLSSQEKLKIVSALLKQAQNNGITPQIIEFFKKNETNIRTFEDNRQFTLDDKPARVTYPIDSQDRTNGMLNDGIWYHTNSAGQPRVTKVLRIPLGQISKDEIKKILHAIKSMYQAEVYGGPKLFSFGVANQQKKDILKRRYQIGMEELFSGEEKQNLKTATPSFMLSKDANGNSHLQKMADLFLRALHDKVCMEDPDFMMNTRGQTRVFDSQSWSFFFDYSSSNLSKFALSLKDVINEIWRKNDAMENKVLASREFLVRFFQGLKATQTLTDDEKLELVTAFFTDGAEEMPKTVYQTLPIILPVPNADSRLKMDLKRYGVRYFEGIKVSP